jgi:hypothetical protein
MFSHFRELRAHAIPVAGNPADAVPGRPHEMIAWSQARDGDPSLGLDVALNPGMARFMDHTATERLVLIAPSPNLEKIKA